MATDLLVEQRIDDGRSLIARLLRDGFDVSIAFWVKTSEEGLWFLYIGSRSVDVGSNLGDSYRRLYACLSRGPRLSISLSDVKLVNVTNPIAQAATALRNQHSARMLVQYQMPILGGLAVEEVFIYPPLGPMTPNEVMQTVVNLMSRRGAIQPSEVSLFDGSTVHGIPRGISTSGSLVQVELLDATGINRSIPLDQIASIQ